MSKQMRAKIPEVDNFFRQLESQEGTEVVHDCLEIKRLKEIFVIKARKERTTELETALHKLLTRNRSARSSKQKEFEQFVVYATDVCQSYKISSSEFDNHVYSWIQSSRYFNIKFSQPLTEDQKEMIDDLEIFVRKASVMGRTISNEAAFPTLESHGEEFVTSDYPAQLWIDQWRDFCENNPNLDLTRSEDDSDVEYEDKGKNEGEDSEVAEEEGKNEDEDGNVAEDEVRDDDCDDDDDFNFIFEDWPPQITMFETSDYDDWMERDILKSWSKRCKPRLKRSAIKELLHLRITQRELAAKHPVWSNCTNLTSKPWENAKRLLDIFHSIEENEQMLKELSESSNSGRRPSEFGQNSSAIFMIIQDTTDIIRFDDKKPSKKESKEMAGSDGNLQEKIRKQLDSQSQERTTNEFSDIMISYNWSSGKDLALRLSKDLKTAGYKVWIDEEEMGIQIHESMEKAVRYSKIILPILSREYEESTNCLLEFNYAFDLRKKIIPILCQKGYRAEGTVRMKTLSLLYSDFSRTGDDDKDDKKYAKTFRNLVKQIQKLIKKTPQHRGRKSVHMNIEAMLFR